MKKEIRQNMLHFAVNDTELSIIERKMNKLGIRNLSAFLRAMALNGFILKLNLPEIRELIRLLSNLTNNVNQIAKRLNAHGSIYETELDDIQHSQKELWDMMNSILIRLNDAATQGGNHND